MNKKHLKEQLKINLRILKENREKILKRYNEMVLEKQEYRRVLKEEFKKSLKAIIEDGGHLNKKNVSAAKSKIEKELKNKDK